MRQIQLLILLTFVSTILIAQDNYIVDNEISSIKFSNTHISNSNKVFSLEKFSMGISGGINFSLIIPYQRVSIFSGQPTINYDKDYNLPFENLGTQMGFILMYDIGKMVKISLQPSSNKYSYKYRTTYQWTGNTILEFETQYTHSLHLFELPLITGFYMSYKTWQPYFQGGIYYGRLLNGTANISQVETSSNLAGSSQSLSYSTSSSSTDLYVKNHFGILAGAGISYLIGKSRIGIEANYKVLLTNLNTIETQYSNNQIVSGTYDIPDKFKFSNLSINLNLIVPIKCNGSSGSKSSGFFCE